MDLKRCGLKESSTVGKECHVDDTTPNMKTVENQWCTLIDKLITTKAGRGKVYVVVHWEQTTFSNWTHSAFTSQ